jgi:hypothetical protein
LKIDHVACRIAWRATWSFSIVLVFPRGMGGRLAGRFGAFTETPFWHPFGSQLAAFCVLVFTFGSPFG